MIRRLAIIAAVLVLPSCSAPPVRPAPAQAPTDTSGFLDDYSTLRPGAAGDVLLVYRNPNANWRAYHAVLLEPVTLWRSGKGSLAAVPEQDLLRLANDFEATVRKRLGDGFQVVEKPGPGVLIVRLGITQARASDPVLDVLTANADDGAPVPNGGGPLSPEMVRFIDGAAIEGELRDAQSNELLAQGVDRRRSGAPPIATWTDLDQTLALWADRLCSRLEARTGGGS
jgi:hypothetical protein